VPDLCLSETKTRAIAFARLTEETYYRARKAYVDKRFRTAALLQRVARKLDVLRLEALDAYHLSLT